MSEHHTYISTEQLKAEIAEIEALKNGNTEELRRAEANMMKSLEHQKTSGKKLMEQLAKWQTKSSQQVRNAIDDLFDSVADGKINVDEVMSLKRRLEEAVAEAASEVERLVQETKNSVSTAEQLYLEMSKRFASAETLVPYKRFAGDLQASIRERLSRLHDREVSASAMQLLTTSVIADMYQMDLVVAKQQADFDVKWAVTKSMLEITLAHCRSAKSENRAEIGNPQSELLDINFWTNGQYKDLESELEELNKGLTNGYYDPLYNTKNLVKDQKRVGELEKMLDVLISDARLNYNQSKRREDQALAAMDILAESHDFQEVGKGFEGNDRREAYIVRMRRHTDEAEIEVIVSPTSNVGEFNLTFRLDSKTYCDESVINSITATLAEDFREAGLKIDVNPHCTVEALEPFNPQNPTITEETRRRHNIEARVTN